MAYEFIGIIDWINSKPLTLQGLKGNVVMVDFWTYSCVNCIRTLPHLISLYSKYKSRGFILVGVHSPEFEFEKEAKNIKKAVKDFGIPYPVANDPEMQTWAAFNNRYWPGHYLFDKEGRLVETHFGEGKYAETENLVRRLLGLNELPAAGTSSFLKRIFSGSVTPETYCGSDRGPEIGSAAVCLPDASCKYIDQDQHKPGMLYLDGNWAREPEFLEHRGKEGWLSLVFTASEANLVMAGKGTIIATIDGKALSETESGEDVSFKDKKSVLAVDSPRMYRIFKSMKRETHDLKLMVSGNVQAFAFTFG